MRGNADGNGVCPSYSDALPKDVLKVCPPDSEHKSCRQTLDVNPDGSRKIICTKEEVQVINGTVCSHAKPCPPQGPE